jgi:peroxiredoxin
MKSLSLALVVLSSMCLTAQESQNKAEQIEAQLKRLRQLSDTERVKVTRELALRIRQLPETSEQKEPLAEQLANLVTEGDPGRETLQEVATTLAQALQQRPVVSKSGEPAEDYIALAQLVRYEHVRVSLDDPRFAAATKKLEADDQSRQKADFTLTDLGGMKWNLRALAGKVVLVNFWATWCPPCRKELPDLEALYQRFGSRGFVILAISDEDAGKVAQFVAAHNLTYPVLLDPGRKVNELLQISGIPKSFVYDRSGKLAAEAIDMRTQRQFLEMLQRAGLQ